MCEKFKTTPSKSRYPQHPQNTSAECAGTEDPWTFYSPGDDVWLGREGDTR